MSDCDEGVPPLEDMTEMLQQAQLLKETKEESKQLTDTVINSKGRERKQAADTVTNGKGDGLINTKVESVPKPDLKTADTKAQTKDSSHSSSNTSKNQANSSSFGGMKKGFLFGGSSSSNKPKTVAKTEPKKENIDDMPLIKPKISKEEEMQMPEVQDAMKAGQAFVQNKEWMTEDLLEKVMNNANLRKKLDNPQFMQAMAEFQTNPKAAQQKYANNKEVQTFLKEFCGIMGQHFEKLADVQEKSTSQQSSSSSITTQATESADLSVHSSTNPNQPTAEDERKMKKILATQEISEVFRDPRVLKLMETLRNDPDKAQKELKLADADLRAKIQKLVDCGLLQFQS